MGFRGAKAPRLIPNDNDCSAALGESAFAVFDTFFVVIFIVLLVFFVDGVPGEEEFGFFFEELRFRDV